VSLQNAATLSLINSTNMSFQSGATKDLNISKKSGLK